MIQALEVGENRENCIVRLLEILRWLGIRLRAMVSFFAIFFAPYKLTHPNVRCMCVYGAHCKPYLVGWLVEQSEQSQCCVICIYCMCLWHTNLIELSQFQQNFHIICIPRFFLSSFCHHAWLFIQSLARSSTRTHALITWSVHLLLYKQLGSQYSTDKNNLFTYYFSVFRFFSRFCTNYNKCIRIWIYLCWRRQRLWLWRWWQ